MDLLEARRRESDSSTKMARRRNDCKILPTLLECRDVNLELNYVSGLGCSISNLSDIWQKKNFPSSLTSFLLTDYLSLMA